MTSLLLLKIILCARQHLNFIRHLTFWLLFHLWLLWGKCTLGARDSSSAVSGFCQGFSLRSKMCRPSANTENSSPQARKTSGTQGKGNVDFANNFNNMTSIWRQLRHYINQIFSWGHSLQRPIQKALPKRGTFFHVSGILKGKDFIRSST